MVKVRFAPSPTGHLHIGNARTAVINYLFAKREKGIFSLRIEDTDVKRSDKTYEHSILEDLEWLGIKWDEGPIRQSERLELYKKYVEILLERGYAYRCFCTREELEEQRAITKAKKLPPRYDGRCSRLTEKEIERNLEEKKEFVIRFKSYMKPVKFQDLIHGELSFPYDHVDDFIIMRADGTPSYNFSVVVDDMLLGITHVIRGADHISNTPKQIMLFEALGSPHPVYAHHSLFVGSDKKPLSKRHGVTGIRDFRNMGILKEALLNYLGIVGRYTEKEFVSEEELIKTFDLSSLSRGDVVFDMEKLLWLNKEHIKFMPVEKLLREVNIPSEYAKKVEILKENIKTLNELGEYLSIFDGEAIDSDALEYLSKVQDISAILKTTEIFIKEHQDFTFDDLFNSINGKLSLSKRDLLMSLRIIFTGKKSGPPLSDVFPLISKESIKKRIQCLKETFLVDYTTD